MFTTLLPRDAMLSRYVLWLCVRLSVRHMSACSKTAKYIITQMPHDSPGKVVFWRQRSWWNSDGVTSNGGVKYLSKTVQDKRI